MVNLTRVTERFLGELLSTCEGGVVDCSSAVLLSSSPANLSYLSSTTVAAATSSSYGVYTSSSGSSSSSSGAVVGRSSEHVPTASPNKKAASATKMTTRSASSNRWIDSGHGQNYDLWCVVCMYMYIQLSSPLLLYECRGNTIAVCTVIYAC